MATQTPTRAKPDAARMMPVPSIATLARDGREQLKRYVREQITELEGEIKILKDTQRAIEGNHAPARAGNGAKTTSRSRTRGQGSKPVSEEMVLEAIRAGMGEQSPELAKALHASSETILRRLRSLEAKGMVRREGNRRDTRWVLGLDAPK